MFGVFVVCEFFKISLLLLFSSNVYIENHNGQHKFKQQVFLYYCHKSRVVFESWLVNTSDDVICYMYRLLNKECYLGAYSGEHLCVLGKLVP